MTLLVIEGAVSEVTVVEAHEELGIRLVRFLFIRGDRIVDVGEVESMFNCRENARPGCL